MREPPALLLGLLLLAALPTSGQEAAERPNIVLILADDLGYGEVGAYGQRRIRTPNLDRLAREGMRFTAYYAGSAVCAPSRCTLLTGLHTGHAQIRNNSAGYWKPTHPSGEGQVPLRAGTETVATLLRRAGYATCAIGKWGLGGPANEGEPNRHGFDHWFGYLCQRQAHSYYPDHLWRNGKSVALAGNRGGRQLTGRQLTGRHYSPDLMLREALAFVAEHRSHPFFLYYATIVPHVPLQVPEDSLREYEGAFEETPYNGDKGYLPHPTPRAAYAAMVTRMDRDIGRLLASLEALGLREKTLVLFTSDNGPTFNGGSDSRFFASAGPFRGLKGSLHEGGIRVPFIGAWPGRIAAGSRSDHVSAFWDVLPTLAELTGQRLRGRTDGVSFLPALLGRGAQEEHRDLYWELGRQQAARRGDWKAYRRAGRNLELYDLARDPGESRNVAADHPEVQREMERLLDRAHVPSDLFKLPSERRG